MSLTTRIEVGGTLYELSAGLFGQGAASAKLPEFEALRALALAVDADPSVLRRLRGLLGDFAAQCQLERLDDDEILEQIAHFARTGALAMVPVLEAEEAAPTSRAMQALAEEMKALAYAHLGMTGHKQEEIDQADLSFIDRFLRAIELGAEDFTHGISKLKLVISSTSKLAVLAGLKSAKLDAKALKAKLAKMKAEIARKIPSSDGRFKQASLWLTKLEAVAKKKSLDDAGAKAAEKLFKQLEDLLHRVARPGKEPEGKDKKKKK